MSTKWLISAVVGGFFLSAPRPSTALAALSGVTSGRAATDPAGPLVAVVALVGWLLLAWLGLVALLLIAGRTGTGRAAALIRTATTWIAPAAARRLVAAALGLGLVTLGAAPASADPGSTARYGPGASAPPAAAVPAPPGGGLDWPSAAQDDPEDQLAQPAVAAVGRTVAPGDSLWRIAAQELGPDASAAQIAQAWPTWWQANRAAIGADPDLLHPGTRLIPPTTPPSPTRPSSPQP